MYHRFLNLLQYNMLRENCQCFFIYKLMIHSIMSSMSYIPENSEESLTGDWATRLNDSYLHDSREDLVLKISSIVHDNEVITTAWVSFDRLCKSKSSRNTFFSVLWYYLLKSNY